MRKPIECPKCDDFLVIITEQRFVRALCRECGWHKTWMPPPADDALDDAISEAVREARTEANGA